MSHHHHHHHRHKHSSSSGSAAGNPAIGGLDLNSALKNINLPSLASSLIGNMDIGQLFGVLAGMASSPLKNTVSPQYSASPIIKKDNTQSSTSTAEKKDVDEEKEDNSKELEQNASSEMQTASVEANTPENPYQNLKFDPEKLSDMLNTLVNMVNNQPRT